MLDELIKKDNCVFCTYARSAIYLSLRVFNVQEREVILPAFTCQTNIPSAIRYAGGIPIFVDIDIANLNIDIASLKSKITDKTAAIIVHCYYGGIPGNLFEIDELVRKNDIKLIIDAAHSYGEYMPIIGDVLIYSFSKFFCNPGGGYALFKCREKCIEAKDFQHENEASLHSVCMNPMLFGDYNALISARDMEKECTKVEISLLKRVIGKFCRITGLYKFQDYYKNYMSINFGDYDTRMTDEQYDFIQYTLNLKEYSIFKRRKMIGSKLKSILPNVVQSKTYPLYAIWVKDIYAANSLLAGANIRARYTWPVFQDYENAQLTKNVNYVKKHLLLLDVDTLDNEKINFIKLHKGDIAIE